MPRVSQSISAKAVESGGLLEAVNREILPLLREMRRVLNVVAGDSSSITEDYTAKLYDRRLFVDATDAAVTVTLPSADDSDGYSFFVKKTDVSANAVTVSSADDIDGAGTYSLAAQYDAVLVHSHDGTYHIEAVVP